MSVWRDMVIDGGGRMSESQNRSISSDGQDVTKPDLTEALAAADLDMKDDYRKSARAALLAALFSND